MNKFSTRVWIIAAAVLCLGIVFPELSQPSTSACTWDSASWKNPTRPTHSLITKAAIESLQADYPELSEYSEQLICYRDGSAGQRAAEAIMQCAGRWRLAKSVRYLAVKVGRKVRKLLAVRY